MPAWLEGRGAELWREVIGFAAWLTVADGYKLAAWCDRQSDFEVNRASVECRRSPRASQRSEASSASIRRRASGWRPLRRRRHFSQARKGVPALIDPVEAYAHAARPAGYHGGSSGALGL